jgi:ergothioneine biosynthesis protein EgtB
MQIAARRVMASTQLDSHTGHAAAAGVSAPPREAGALLGRYRQVRERTRALCAPLAIEDQVVQSMTDASPAKWHLAHTTWFFEELVLRQAERDFRPEDARFAYLFNSYYNSLGRMHARARRGLLSRPTVGEIHAYRSRVDERMARLLAGPGLTPTLEAVLVLGLNHEEQHQELLLTDIKHLFSLNPLQPAYAPAAPAPAAGAAAAPLAWHAFPGGFAEIGHPGTGFCFDNEQPRHGVWLEPYRLASRPVSNGDLKEFVRDGGYRRAGCWLSDGWDHVRRGRWRRPLYWAESLDHEHTLSGPRELDPAAPACHLSYYEADAFARWAGARLPTEAEWEAAAARAPVTGNFLATGLLHPCAGGSCSAGTPAQMFGDVWEWTSSAYSPYPGYRADVGALGEYNGKFMVSQLVLRGGSCLTPAGHIRASYRNFFHPAARWQMTGVRLAA